MKTSPSAAQSTRPPLNFGLRPVKRYVPGGRASVKLPFVPTLTLHAKAGDPALETLVAVTPPETVSGRADEGPPTMRRVPSTPSPSRLHTPTSPGFVGAWEDPESGVDTVVGDEPRFAEWLVHPTATMTTRPPTNHAGNLIVRLTVAPPFQVPTHAECPSPRPSCERRAAAVLARLKWPA
jgi:hypothetical protein